MKETDKKKYCSKSYHLTRVQGSPGAWKGENEFRKRVCFEVLWVCRDKEHRILVVVGQQRKSETMTEGK